MNVLETKHHGQKKIAPISSLIGLIIKNTSDEDSSDDEIIKQYDEQMEQKFEDTTELTKEQMREHHELIEQYNNTEDCDESLPVRVMIHRGLHLSPQHFNIQERRQLIKKILNGDLDSPITLSSATQKRILANKKVNKNDIHSITDSEALSSQSHADIMQALDKLKNTNNKQGSKA